MLVCSGSIYNQLKVIRHENNSKRSLSYMNYNTVILPQVLLCSLSEGTMTFPGKEREECLACKLFVTVPGNMTPRPTCYLSKKTEVTGSSQGLNKI